MRVVADSMLSMSFFLIEVFAIQDLMFIGLFTSSDVFSAIEPGNTYRVYVRGKRIPFLSSYKNIIEVRKE